MFKEQMQTQTVKTNYTAMQAVVDERENKNIREERTLAGLGVIFGESGSGKSFIALDLAYAVARGIPWMGMKAVQGNVMYILAEGTTGFGMRIKAYRQHNGIGGRLPLYILADSPDLLKVNDVKEVIRSIQEIGGASLIIVDSLFSATLGGYYGNMSLVTAHCKKIQEQTGASILLIHHEALPGAWDFEIEVKRDGDKRSLTIARQKDEERIKSSGSSWSRS